MSYSKELDTPFAQEWLPKSTSVILAEIDARTHNMGVALTVYNSSGNEDTKKLIKERAAKLESLLLILAFRNLHSGENKIFKSLMTAAYVEIDEAKKI